MLVRERGGSLSIAFHARNFTNNEEESKLAQSRSLSLVIKWILDL